MGVLCMHFLNNQCRFGAKCTKDHVDIRTLVKSEIDESLKGNQYLLSCYGPFKGKILIKPKKFIYILILFYIL